MASGRSTGLAGAGRRRFGSAPQFCSSGRSTTSLRGTSSWAARPLVSLARFRSPTSAPVARSTLRGAAT
eukprot:789903-Pyramimonas_sp.AAC.1